MLSFNPKRSYLLIGGCSGCFLFKPTFYQKKEKQRTYDFKAKTEHNDGLIVCICRDLAKQPF